jgi:hypothetical protein
MKTRPTDPACDRAGSKEQKQQSDVTLEELMPIFGTADPRILFYRDYCGDFGGGYKKKRKPK